ncbi:MAG: hypothetical protein PVH88_24900 [Ignavibacteria bacterium]|jgi:hypothetical protein
MKKLFVSLFVVIPFLLSCSSLTLKPADFAWPVEAVLTADENDTVEDKRYSISFNVSQIYLSEFGDSTFTGPKEIRVIRNTNGFYFVTAKEFKNVYVFEPGNGSLSLNNKILISEQGLRNPAMNQRSPYIELIDGDKSYNLSSKGIIRK